MKLKLFAMALFGMIMGWFILEPANAQDNPNVITLQCDQSPYGASPAEMWTWTIDFGQGSVSWTSDGETTSWIDGQSSHGWLPHLTITVTTIHLLLEYVGSGQSDDPPNMFPSQDINIDRISGNITMQSGTDISTGPCVKVQTKTAF